ncbi:MAG: ATP-dependent sacrificial sulfur transferase LarE [Candidatus Omnitrophica bacterium]|nr:ATP-dependent sacrificial sulfur transferase LarE [Candidatus Omnitrophota bacterium]
MNKLRKLKKILQAMDSVLVAYSGGIDSTFLLKIAHEVLKDKVLAVTANSPTYPPEELTFSKRMARILGARHKIIQTQELQDARFIANPVNRCYFCKKELFSRLKDIARNPGNKAKEELGVCSPLEQAGFTKDDIRRLSNKLGLKTWNKPSLACLASRIPYGTKITPHLLERIDKAENVLRRMGLNQVRLRHYNGLCRIEVMKKDILALIRKGDLIVERFKKMGYNYVTLDLEGYRTGSLNEVIKK